MRKTGLERDVLQLAISARQCLNDDPKDDLESACYTLLVGCRKAAEVLKSPDAYFIRTMVESYEGAKRQEETIRQYLLFDEEKK